MKELTCIVCPNGCKLQISAVGKSLAVSGNKCPKGEQFAIAEQTNPVRTLCSTVKTAFPRVPVLPVRVTAEIPKSRIFDVMGEINRVFITEPIGCGAVIIPNVLGLGADVIATSGILKTEGI